MSLNRLNVMAPRARATLVVRVHWMEPRDVLLSELNMKINDRSQRSLSSYHGGARSSPQLPTPISFSLPPEWLGVRDYYVDSIAELILVR